MKNELESNNGGTDINTRLNTNQTYVYVGLILLDLTKVIIGPIIVF